MMEKLNNQEQAINKLREDIIDMMNLVLRQLDKAHRALNNLDVDLANEIISLEKKVNATDILIDKSCENILALYSPVATDLRFVLAVMSIASQLERIGDHAEAIAKYILDGVIHKPLDTKSVEKLEFDKMFETSMSMVDDAIYSFINEDTELSKWVFGKDKVLNEINLKSISVIIKLIEKNPDEIGQILHLFSIMKKLERIGDLAKNIAEETVFFIDAKIIKHKRAKKYKQM